MKTILSLAIGLMVMSHPARALTVIHEIRSESECPANLQVQIRPSEKEGDLVVIQGQLAPHEPELYRGRVKVHGRLVIAAGGKPLFDGPVEMRPTPKGYVCRFRISKAALAEARLTLSTQLYEKDGHPTLGGGDIYQIDLGSFQQSLKAGKQTTRDPAP